MNLDKVFEPGLLEEINEKSELVKVRTGETILKPGQQIKFFPILLKGLIKILRTDEEGRELLLYYINPGESCAMTITCCMQLHKSEVTAIAEEDSEILTIPVSNIDTWLMKYPTWKSFVVNTFRGKIDELLKIIDMIAFQKLDERLVGYLKNKSQVSGSTVLNLSHQQVADELATSRVVISRLLKKLENDGKIILFRSQIKLMKKL